MAKGAVRTARATPSRGWTDESTWGVIERHIAHMGGSSVRDNGALIVTLPRKAAERVTLLKVLREHYLWVVEDGDGIS